MFTEILRYNELDENLINRWKQLISSQKGYESPFFHPQFTDVVSRCRDDVFVLVHGIKDRADFILPFQKNGTSACPVGAPFSDYHGPIMAADFNGRVPDILETAGLSSYRFSTLFDMRRRFESFALDRDGAFVCDLSLGADVYFEEQRQNFPRHAKKLRRLQRKIEREVGETAFIFDDDDEAGLELLFDWKSEQYRQSGRHDVLSPEWVRAMFRLLWTEKVAGCRTVFHTLKTGGQLIAGEFNLLGTNTIHGWIPSFDRQFWSYSPGYLLQEEIIRHAAAAGYRDYDLGVSAGHYKKYYASFQIPVLRGRVRTNGLNSRIEQTAEQLWNSLEKANLPKMSALAGKVRRRYGLIADVETSWSGRVRGVMQAAGQLLPTAGGSTDITNENSD